MGRWRKLLEEIEKLSCGIWRNCFSDKPMLNFERTVKLRYIGWFMVRGINRDDSSPIRNWSDD